ncbi:MAG: DUF4440 domain-containing protein [Cyclobacteriaceae bacterium]|jgi:hypothetical protein|nr:DUF4440 domain-containing protein [Cyclobacteriaceae bacterium]
MKSFACFIKSTIAVVCWGACSSKIPVPPEYPSTEIRHVLARQQEAWNAGNIEVFMEGYWKSDSLQFVGSSVRHGWQQTLDGYKKGYPTREAMGTLQFDIWQVLPLTGGSWLVSGRYTLVRTSDQPTGPFTLIFQKKQGRWVVVFDHTC